MSLATHFFLTPENLRQIIEFRDQPAAVSSSISLDLGMNRVIATLSREKCIQIGKRMLPIPEEFRTSEDERTIYIWRAQAWEKWQTFDEKSGKYYKMVFVQPGKPPTIEISGIKMHITQNGDPEQDTQFKLKSLKQLQGHVLDTCMGLGYTAIAASSLSKVKEVICCEKDPVVLEFCQENPWSQSLFRDPKIHPLLFPVDEFVTTLPDSFIDTIIHDPPRFALAPELYSAPFYTELYRILRPGGGIYHYTGNPNRQTRRTALAQKTAQLLLKTGFRQANMAYAGVVARK